MEKFIAQLKTHLDPNENLIQTIASVLECSYDAAYRITRGMTQLKLEDALRLSQYFNVSLDALNEGHSQNFIFVRKVKRNISFDTITQYLIDSYENLKLITKDSNSKITYSSKDIPIFHTLQDNYITRLKFYSWLWMSDDTFAKKKLPFTDFQLKQSTIDAGKNLADLYENIHVTEFWSETTINSLLLQLNYFYDLKTINSFEKEKIKEEVIQLLMRFEDKAATSPKYHIYWNEMLLMNNSILAETYRKSIYFIPYNVLDYFQVFDPDSIEEQQQFFFQQKQNSILISGNNQKVRNLFFETLKKTVHEL